MWIDYRQTQAMFNQTSFTMVEHDGCFGMFCNLSMVLQTDVLDQARQ